MPDLFHDARPGSEVSHGAAAFELPILYFRDDAFILFFTADLPSVRARMPSDRLHPVALPGGRALFGIAAFNYIDTTLGPYGEVAVVVPVVHADRRPFPLLPGLLEGRYPGFGNLVLHLPVTRIEPRDAGRGEWGLSKFVADMRFLVTHELFECEVSERGAHILTLGVARRGFIARDRRPLITYSVRNRDLIRTVMPQHAIACNKFLPRDCFMRLGSHEVAESIRELKPSKQPLLSRHFLQRSLILPSGEVVERGVRPLDGYRGRDDPGVHHVRYLSSR